MRLGTVLKDYEAREGFERKTAWLILMLIYTGARLNEVLKAKWEWVNFDRGVLMLPDTKSNEEQEIQLPTVAMDLLYKIKKYKTKGHSYIFEGAKAGEPMYDEGKHWVKIKEKAGIENFRIHDLRHAFASIAIMETGSMAFVSGLLRHANIKTAQRYAHLMNDPLKSAANAAANKLHELMNGNVVDLDTKRRLG